MEVPSWRMCFYLLPFKALNWHRHLYFSTALKIPEQNSLIMDKFSIRQIADFIQPMKLQNSVKIK